jgi:hypothetical protein
MCTIANSSPNMGECDVPDRPLVPLLRDAGFRDLDTDSEGEDDAMPALTFGSDTSNDSDNAEQRDMQVATQDSVGHPNGEDGEDPRATPRHVFDGMAGRKTSVPVFVRMPIGHAHSSMDQLFPEVPVFAPMPIQFSRRPDHRSRFSFERNIHSNIRMDQLWNTSNMKCYAALVDAYYRKPVDDRGPAPVGYSSWLMDTRWL